MFTCWPVGGDEGIRTPGLRLAKAALSQLSYIPILRECLSMLAYLYQALSPHETMLVGLPGFEPGTFPLSEERSNQLS